MGLHAKQEAAVGKGIEMNSTQSAVSNTLLLAASTLAENLAQSESFLRFQEADRKLQADGEATGFLTEVAELQQQIRAQQQSGAISESDVKRLRQLQNIINANNTIQEFGKAQDLAAAFLREVNQEISNLLGIDFASLTRRSGGCC
jgi:cell fate (sporulation/competence/biofilm development) regulator YlbF (YheA/YmcA/DUF963 family)